MFGIGMPELIVIAIIALVVVGPKRLPDLARTFGKGLNEFRRATEGATDTLKASLHMDDIKQEVDDVKESFKFDTHDGAAKSSSSPAAEGKEEATPPNPPPQGPSTSTT